MGDLVVYKENQIDIIKKITYYKKLGINAILLDPFIKLDEEIIEKVLYINSLLADKSIKLFVKIDMKKISSLLLDTKEEDLPWNDPKIRKSFYQFINYLKKHDISGLYFSNFEDLFFDNSNFYLREMSKNILATNEITSIVEVDSDDLNYQNYLSHGKSGLFSYVFNKNLIDNSNDFLDSKKCLSAIQDRNINQIYTTDNNLKNFTNNKNFPFLTSSLLAGVSFLLKGAIILKDFEELGIFSSSNYSNDYKVLDQTNKTFEFYQKLIKIKIQKEAIIEGKYREIFNKDPDIFAFIRTFKNKKIIVFANFTQKEILADIRFHFIDRNDFHYLLGNYGRRKIVKNLLLRPYEFIAFIKWFINILYKWNII